MPWTPEVVVTPALAASLIGDQFPDLARAPITTLATGWDNTAYVVGDQWLFRFPRREIAVPGVRREIAVLPRLAPLLPLPIPNPTFIGQPSDRYGWPFFGARMLPGRELADSELPDSQRIDAAESVGEFLRALHDPSLVTLPECADLPVDPMGRGKPKVRAGRAREVLARLAQSGVWPPGEPSELDADVGRLLDEADRYGESATPGGRAGLVLCHGDLHIRHLLVDPAGAAAGVIDWGDLCLGDPAVDLGIAYMGFAGAARAALLDAYGRSVSATQELAARTLAVSLAAYLAEYAADDKRPVLLAEAIAGLRRAVSA
jgi:aminoglycoside phosphotransferase (APT) family kinase protein